MLPTDGLFGGFDPEVPQDRWFERHRGVALALAVACHIGLAGVVAYLELNRDAEKTVEVLLDEPEIENIKEEIFEEEEELEIEPEPEIEAPPPSEPPPKQQKIRNVDEHTKDVSESEVAPQRAPVEYEPEPEPEPEPESEPEPVAKPVDKPAPKRVAKKKPKPTGVGDRTAPRAMPAEGTPPKPLKSNTAPAYPESLRKKNITGTVKVKLKIYMDGSVRGMKVLRKDIHGTDDPEELKRAQSLLLKSVVKAVKNWKFDPAKLRGSTITVWWPVTFPFKLS